MHWVKIGGHRINVEQAAYLETAKTVAPGARNRKLFLVGGKEVSLTVAEAEELEAILDSPPHATP